MGTSKIFYEASQDIDFLSCEAIHPILHIEANNKREAIRKFKETQKQ